MITIGHVYFYVKEENCKIDIIEGTVIDVDADDNDYVKFTGNTHKLLAWVKRSEIHTTKDSAMSWSINYLENKKRENNDMISKLTNMNTYINTQIKYLNKGII